MIFFICLITIEYKLNSLPPTCCIILFKINDDYNAKTLKLHLNIKCHIHFYYILHIILSMLVVFIYFFFYANSMATLLNRKNTTKKKKPVKYTQFSVSREVLILLCV